MVYRDDSAVQCALDEIQRLDIGLEREARVLCAWTFRPTGISPYAMAVQQGDVEIFKKLHTLVPVGHVMDNICHFRGATEGDERAKTTLLHETAKSA